MATIKQLTIENLTTSTTVSESIGADAQNIDVARNSSGDITDVTHQSTSEALNVTLNNIEDKLGDIQHNFIGTLEEWNALTEQEKAQYDTYDIIDEYNAIPIDDQFDANSSNPVQNRTIKSALDGKLGVNDVAAWAKASTKPDYTAAEVSAVATSEKGAAGGVAELDNSGKVPAAQLPSYVDDVIEVNDYVSLPLVGETGKIYITLDTNKEYRWGGSTYVSINDSLALGETESTAYRGDRGKIAYDDSQANKTAIGTLSNLTTTSKTDLVSAINEVNAKPGPHTIVNKAGTSVTQRGNLQFKGATLIDDSTNGATIVDIDVDNALSDSSENPVQNKVINTALSGKAASSHNHAASDINSGILGVARGGTGAATLTSGRVIIGNGTGAVKFRAIDTTAGGTSGSTSLITSGAVYAMKSSFQAGCDTIVQAVTAKGQTPASNSPTDIATAIGNISTGGDDHTGLSLEDFNAMTNSQLSALSIGETKYGDDINSSDIVTRNISSGLVAFNIKDFFVSKITKVNTGSSEFDFNTVLFLLNEGDYSVKSSLVGKLVTGMTNSIYSGKYRIIGYDHDGTTNTLDLITEDCVASMTFSTANRHYNDGGCTARIYVEETFYNAFSSDVKSHILPMDVVYYYSTSGGTTGTKQTNTRYGKLLSFNEIGYGISGPSKFTNAPNDVEGNLYPYYNNTTSSLRIKKYNGSAVSWWLRSRVTNDSSATGYIYITGSASSNYYTLNQYVAPVLRIG